MNPTTIDKNTRASVIEPRVTEACREWARVADRKPFHTRNEGRKSAGIRKKSTSPAVWTRLAVALVRFGCVSHRPEEEVYWT